MENMLLSKRTIFNLDTLGYFLKVSDRNTLKKKVARLVERNKLERFKRNLYFIPSKGYNKYELANAIFPPSYVSFETVLVSSGFIFQPYSSIFSVGKENKKYLVDNTIYIYRKIDPEIISDIAGLEHIEEYFGDYWIAGPERAVLDTLSLNPDFYFDKLIGLDFKKARKIASIYENDKLISTLNNWKKEYVRYK